MHTASLRYFHLFLPKKASPCVFTLKNDLFLNSISIAQKVSPTIMSWLNWPKAYFPTDFMTIRTIISLFIYFGITTLGLSQEPPPFQSHTLWNVELSPTAKTTLLQITGTISGWASAWLLVLCIIILLSLSFLLYRFHRRHQWQRQENSRLQELNDLKNRLYTNIIHEFRTPLTVIQGMTERIQGHEKERKIIQRNNADLLNLVNQILELQKIESRKLTLNMVQGDMIFYLRYILESFNPLAEDNGVELHFLNQERELIMDYDKEKLLRIVSNLLSNAIKFTPKGGNVYLAVDTSVEASPEPESAELEQQFVNISISDTGIGIPKEKLPHVFDRFYRVFRENNSYQKRDRQKGEGTGIGMALTMELVKILNGTIEIESKVDEGTKIKLRLPILRQAPRASEEEMSETSTTAMAPAILVGNATQPTPVEAPQEQDAMPYLLLIEDNPDIVTYVSTLLEDDYQVSTAPDGQVGVEKALDQIPDIIISDIMMPKKDGFEVCETLKNDDRTSHIPIILLTGKIDVDSRMAGLKRGADAYLTKPFHQEELFIRLEQLLALRKRLQQRYQSLDTTLPPSDEPAVQQEDIFMGKVRKTVEKRMKNKNFSTPELSKALGMSRSHLHLKIKALTGLPTSHYIRSIRLQKAKELLETTDEKISDIAAQVGFSRPTYFSRLFSEQYGQSPRQFRQ